MHKSSQSSIKLGVDYSDVISKSKTMTVFAQNKEYTLDAIRSRQSQEKTEQSESERKIDMLIDEAKLSDALFIEFGVTSEQLENSVMYYISQNDVEIKELMAQFVQEMQDEQNIVEALKC